MKNVLYSKTFRIVLLIFGLAGVVLYFPCKMPADRTCLFEHFNADSYHHDTSGEKTLNHAHELARHYVLPFGVVWWFSIAAVWWSIAGIRKKKRTEL